MTGAGCAVHLADAAVEFEARDDLAAENAECVGLRAGESTGRMVEHEERTDGDAAGCGERGAGVKAIRSAFEDDAVGGVVGVVARVGDLVDGVAEDGGFAGKAAQGELVGFDAKTGTQPDAVRANQGDGGDGSVAELRGQTGDVVEDGIGRGIEDLVLIEGFDPESFVFDQERVHL